MHALKMIDTHTHLYDEAFNCDGGGEMAVARAIEAGVDKMILPNVDIETIAPLKRLAEKFPENLKYAVGLHPTEVRDDWRQVVETLVVGDSGAVAIGEIGIDLYWDKTFVHRQKEAFDAQCGIAVASGLPVIIHCRDGLAETLEILRNHPSVKGVFHSFGGSREDVEAIRAVGDFYFGINGIVTFKNSGLKETLPSIGLNRIVLETDSPYLAPVPYRGKRNESSYLLLIAQHVADALGIDIATVAQTTTSNAQSLFGI